MGVPSGPNGQTLAEERRDKRAAKRQHKADVYRAVDRRDGQECRCCGRRCSPTAIGLLERAERHHIIPRSLNGPDETWNLITLCRDCHDDRHARGTLRIEGNADTVDGTGRFCGVTFERQTEAGWKVEMVA